jgi:hypothetical protein
MSRGARDNRFASPRLSEEEAAPHRDRSSALPPVSSLRGSAASKRTREMLITTDRGGDRIASANNLSMPVSAPVSSGRWASPESGVRSASVTRLYATAFSTIELDRQNLLVRFTRSEQSFSTIAEMDHEMNEIERVLEKFRRSRLLVDLRAAVPPRDEPALDAAMVRFRHRLLRGSDRAVILVRTAVGALQVKRHMREDGSSVEVFQSDDEALAHIDGMQPESAPRASWAPPTPPRRFARR